MSDEDELLAQVHKDIYFFAIEQPATGYARFGSIYKRISSTDRKAALDEIVNGTAPTSWNNVTCRHTPGGLDMRFEPDTRALIFVATPDLSSEVRTVFGGKGAIDLDIEPRRANKIINACLRHPDSTGAQSICSFVIDTKPVADEVSHRPTLHRVTRLPIMFDFVDMPDGVSPVFKEPHGHHVIAHSKAGLGHGGIHPRGGSSIIELS